MGIPWVQSCKTLLEDSAVLKLTEVQIGDIYQVWNNIYLARAVENKKYFQNNLYASNIPRNIQW